jgi:group I intron endonuclease
LAYIYQITNIINGKIYIGKTEKTIEERFKQHCRDAKRQTCEKRPLYAAMRKYGVENFKIELLEETDMPEEREIYWIEKKGSFKNGYNATIGGDGKRYIDYELIIKTYQETQRIKETAKICNVSTDTVHNVLTNKNISIVSSGEIFKNKTQQSVGMYSLETLELIKSFSALSEAARYLIEENKSNGSRGSIVAHIADVCKGNRKNAYGYFWKYL